MKLEEFLAYFPAVDLPVTFSEELVGIFSKNNKVFSQDAIIEYIQKWESDIDDTTEYLPCIQLPSTDEYFAVVYWRGALMRYDYILVTLDKKGNLISRKSIASSIFESKKVRRSVASIDEDLIIHIVAGESTDGNHYDPASSQAFNMEIMPSGDILFSLEDS